MKQPVLVLTVFTRITCVWSLPKPAQLGLLGDTSPYQGTLSLGSRGCTYVTQFVVSGPYRGRVVYVDADGSPPYIVHEPNFLSWYERWLDELLQGYNTSWFGYGPGGGEDDFFHILHDPLAHDEFKKEAAFAFCRLPRLTDKAAPQIAPYLDHPLAGVRAGTLATIAHFQLSDLVALLEPRLEDPSAQVRRQAVNAAMKLAPERYAEAVLRRLREDPDEEVARTALYRLREAKAITKAELLRLLADPGKRNLSALVATTIVWGTEDEPLLIRLLADPNKIVRSNALSSLKQIMGKASLPHLLDRLSVEQDVDIVGHILKALGEFGEPSTVPILLEWGQSADDFHRLEALEALTKIGDERAVQPALTMLQELRPPVRRGADGFMSRSHVRTISELVRQTLSKSPNTILRGLAR